MKPGPGSAKNPQAVTLTFPVVPNPYTLLSTTPPIATHLMVLDLKNAFFTIPLHPLSQSLFTFTWQDPKTHVSQQLTWTVLPQGFRDSPYFWGQALQKDLGEGNGTPLQYSCPENPRDGGAWQAAVHGVAKSQTRLSEFTFTFHFYALEKEMATYSSVLAWRIPEMGSHRVGHD